MLNPHHHLNVAGERYIRDKRLDSGGYGRVFLYKSFKGRNDDVVAKAYHETYVSIPDATNPNLGDVGKLRNVVLAEFDIHKDLKHKNIVEVKAFMELDGFFYIIMEHCENFSLDKVLLRRDHLCVTEVKYYMYNILRGLEYLHDNKIVHRDIKLENILITKNMEVKLGDFGLAAKLPDCGYFTEKCGTINYIAPEILAKDVKYSFPVDVWAAGVLLYALVFDGFPFNDSEEYLIVDKIKEGLLCFPAEAHKGAMELICDMLVNAAKYRPTVSQVLMSPFFKQPIPQAIPPSAMFTEPVFVELPDHAGLFLLTGEKRIVNSRKKLIKKVPVHSNVDLLSKRQVSYQQTPSPLTKEQIRLLTEDLPLDLLPDSLRMGCTTNTSASTSTTCAHVSPDTEEQQMCSSSEWRPVLRKSPLKYVPEYNLPLAEDTDFPEDVPPANNPPTNEQQPSGSGTEDFKIRALALQEKLRNLQVKTATKAKPTPDQENVPDISPFNNQRMKNLLTQHLLKESQKMSKNEPSMKPEESGFTDSVLRTLPGIPEHLRIVFFRNLRLAETIRRLLANRPLIATTEINGVSMLLPELISEDEPGNASRAKNFPRIDLDEMDPEKAYVRIEGQTEAELLESVRETHKKLMRKFEEDPTGINLLMLEPLMNPAYVILMSKLMRQPHLAHETLHIMVMRDAIVLNLLLGERQK